MKKYFMQASATMLAALLLLTGCGADQAASTAQTAGETQTTAPGADAVDDGAEAPAGSTVELEFWSAPVPQQQAFWESMATQYAAVNPNVSITVAAIPESPSSEAGIQSAIASGTAPTMSENVFRGFAAQLAENQAIVPFDELGDPGEIAATRGMENILAEWTFDDGHTYVLPVFSNPSMFLWRIDLLEELGITEVPTTYSDVYAVGQALKASDPEKFVWAGADFTNTSWYKRWWDFLTLYNAASDGNAFVESNALVADDAAAVNVLEFFETMAANDYLLAQETTDPFETGLSLATQFVPFRFKAMYEKYPDLTYGENFVVAPVPVPDGSAATDVKTMSDTKGVVIYAQATEEQRAAAYEFLAWVLSGEHDAEWMSTTNLLPAQDDIANSPALADVFAESPELMPFAENVMNAVPAMGSAKYVEIHTALGEQGMVPVLAGSTDAAAAWEDVKAVIESELG